MMTISLAAVAFGLCRLFLWPQGPQINAAYALLAGGLGSVLLVTAIYFWVSRRNEDSEYGAFETRSAVMFYGFLYTVALFIFGVFTGGDPSKAHSVTGRGATQIYSDASVLGALIIPTIILVILAFKLGMFLQLLPQRQALLNSLLWPYSSDHYFPPGVDKRDEP